MTTRSWESGLLNRVNLPSLEYQRLETRLCKRVELVASACRWDDQAKLVNVATHLRGTASRFYRSCKPQQWSSYVELVAALRKHFTPVHIQSVHSSIFHDRRQRATESLDEYAQDLRKLFHRAYSGLQVGGEAEKMGKSLLSSQFIAGLSDKLKTKMVGRAGVFEEPLAQAHFEEVRRILALARMEPSQTRKNGDGPLVEQGDGETHRPQPSQRSSKTSKGCYSCGGTGHFFRDCPLRGRGAPPEARGKGGATTQPKTLRVSALQPEDEKEKDPKQGTKTNEGPVEEAVSRAIARMYGIEAGPSPILTSEIKVNGSTTKVLLDTNLQ